MGRRLALVLVVLLCLGAAAWWLTPQGPTLVVRPAADAAPVLIRNVRVVDVVAGTATAARDVWLEAGRIARITAHDPAASPPAGTQTLEGEGKTLVPGLIDAHCHVGSSPEPPWDKGLPNVRLNLERLLFAGVTRVFDPGARVPDIFELRAELRAGRELGPHLHAAGPIFTAPGGHPEPMMRQMLPGVVVDYLADGMFRQLGTPAEAAPAVKGLMAYEPDFLKMAIDRIPLDAPRLEPAVAKAIVDAATQEGLRAVAHIGTYEDAIDAADAGVKAWIHGVYKAELDDEQVAKLASYGIPMVPTMIVFESYARLGRGSYPATPLEREMATAHLLESRVNVPADYETPSNSQAFLQLLMEQRQAGRRNVAKLFRAGVTIMAGSDAQAGVVHGAALHRELALLVASGLEPKDALRAATIVPARFLEDTEDPPYGVVAAGKAADLLLVRGDPLADIGALSQIEAVVFGGKVLERFPLAGE